MKKMTKYWPLLILMVLPLLGATSQAIYLHHERSTLAGLEADLQNREIGLDFQNKTVVARFGNGTYAHLLSTEQPNFNLTGTLQVNGSATFLSTITASTLTASRLVATNASNQIISSPVTGTGTTAVLSVSPTITSPTISGTIPGALAATNGTYSGTLGVTGLATINNTLTVNSDAATPGAWGLSTITSSAGNGTQSLDNIRDHASNVFRIRMRTAGSPVTGLSIDGIGSVTLPSLAGTGTRITTSTSTGVQGNATTIAGANTWSNTQTFVAPVLGAATATTIALGGNEAFDYNEGSFTGTLVGCTTSPTMTVRFVRAGKMVTVHIPNTTCTSNSTSLEITGMPAEILNAAGSPSVATGVCSNNSAITTTPVTVYLNGSFLFQLAGSATGWTAAGTKGVYSMAFNYMLN